MRPQDVVLTLGTALRLTRLVVADDIGQWWIKDPIDRAMDRYAQSHASPENAPPWWWKYRSGLDCKWCIGYWIAVFVLLVTVATRRTALWPLWKFAMGTLTLNYVAALLADLEQIGEVVQEVREDQPDGEA